MISKLKAILNKSLIQRVIYALGLIIWTLLLFDRLQSTPHATSSIRLSYLTLYLIPILIFIIQIIRNNKILWGLILGLFSSFILISLIIAVADWIERSGNHVKAIDWTFKDIVLIIFYFGVLSLIDCIIYMINPKKII
jgi:hypothetical protein